MILLFFGQYKEMGYLPQAMVNYLALLGWGDGTENEFFTIDNLGLSATIHSVIFTRIFSLRTLTFGPFLICSNHLFIYPHFGPISHLQLKNSL